MFGSALRAHSVGVPAAEASVEALGKRVFEGGVRFNANNQTRTVLRPMGSCSGRSRVAADASGRCGAPVQAA